MIELSGVTRKFGRTVALKDVNLKVNEGEFLAVTGESGSGKTTLLQIMAGIDKPTEGRVVMAGTDLTDLSENDLAIFRRRNIGFVFQFFHLIPELTVVENVELPMELVRSRWDKTMKLTKRISFREVSYRTYPQVVELLGLVGIKSQYFNRLPDELSGGEKQRVAIARALANDPRILLADQPTENLDPKTGLKIARLFEKVHRELGKTLVIATHSPDIISRASRVVGLEHGQLFERG